MKKNAFTLIELLAVIVILAIIAIIAVPIVIGIINDSKKSSEERMVELYIDQVEKTITKENLKRNYAPNTCEIQEDGSIKCIGDMSNYNSDEILSIDMQGEKPSGGTIIFEKGKITNIFDLTLNDKKYDYYLDYKKILEIPTAPGLYDENYKLLASWDELVNNYGLDVENYIPVYSLPGTLYSIIQNNNNLSNGTLLVISDDVQTIDSQVFSNCANIKNIIIPSSVISMSGGAFSGYTGLESIKVEDDNAIYEDGGVNAIIEKSTNKLIYGCKNTIIPSSVTSIGDGAFSGSGLTSIMIPNSVTSIGNSAFKDCTGLASITIPNSVTSIGNNAFYGSGLTNITIPSGVTKIAFLTFSNCPSLTSITIPSSVTSIEWAAFNHSGLTSVTFENTSGWKVDDDYIDVTNPRMNATNLVNTYSSKNWNRS